MTDGVLQPVVELGDDATAEVAQRAREELGTVGTTLVLYATGAPLLVLEPHTWTAESWAGSVVFLLGVLGALCWQYGTGRGREGQADRLLSEYAVLRHADPGVGRRAPADEAAENFVGGRFLAWLWTPGVLAVPLIAGQWDRPEWAVPGAVLLAVAGLVHLTAREREARAGRRWLADPPGPPRD